jgi:hypothetical protein
MNSSFDREPYMALPQALRTEVLRALSQKEEAEWSGNPDAMKRAMGPLKDVLAKVKAHQREKALSKAFSDAMHPSLRKRAF